MVTIMEREQSISELHHTFVDIRDMIDNISFKKAFLAVSKERFAHIPTQRQNTLLNRIYASYCIYQGFDTLEDCERELATIKSRYVFVKFNNQYYAVSYDSSMRQHVVGRDCHWYVDSNGKFINSEQRPKEYVAKKRAKFQNINLAIYDELLILDKDLEVFFYENAFSTELTKAYQGEFANMLVLLGITFKNMWFGLHDNDILNIYFRNEQNYDYFLKCIKGGTKINPFYREIMLSDKSIIKFETTFKQYGILHSLPAEKRYLYTKASKRTKF